MTDDAGSAPSVLRGLRVLEIGHFVAAPFATRILADLGADIIKIEPRNGDPARQWGAQVGGHSLWWSMHGRNKRSLTLDLKNPKARGLVLELVGQCDAVIENFRPGQLGKLGLAPEVMRAARPGLVVAHISGYGQTGPYRDRAAFGVIGEAIGGLRYLTDHPPGTSDLPPVRVGVSIGDSVAGLYAVIGVLAALWDRDRSGGTGKGRTIDVALTESILSLMEGMLPEYGALGRVKQPTGGGIATAAPTNAYPTADEAFILIAANSEPLFARLMNLVGHPELIGADGYDGNQVRVANSAALDRLIGDWTRRFSAAELEDMLTDADIPSSRVYTAADIAADPQYRAREMVREVSDANFDDPILQAGVVPHVVDTPGAVRWAGPSIGAHTEEVLTELLGLDAAAIATLRSEGVV
jgi:crotonobetainyl-CoA:carnitine CoA-transferase CaiB-like acyl-CoA transferase